MSSRKLLFSALLGCGLIATPAAAQNVESIYTKIDFDSGCIGLSEGPAGGSFSCDGHAGYGILFSEDDLRQSLFFGYVGDWYADGAWESFSQFNLTNDTVEWRLRDGVPHATILRWFIENVNPDTGSPDAAHRGQVLVISKVAQPGEGNGCMVGFVDARANDDANDIARQVADDIAEDFACRTDTPEYHGNRGELAGEPVSSFGQG